LDFLDFGFGVGFGFGFVPAEMTKKQPNHNKKRGTPEKKNSMKKRRGEADLEPKSESGPVCPASSPSLGPRTILTAKRTSCEASSGAKKALAMSTEATPKNLVRTPKPVVSKSVTTTIPASKPVLQTIQFPRPCSTKSSGSCSCTMSSSSSKPSTSSVATKPTPHQHVPFALESLLAGFKTASLSDSDIFLTWYISAGHERPFVVAQITQLLAEAVAQVAHLLNALSHLIGQPAEALVRDFGTQWYTRREQLKNALSWIDSFDSASGFQRASWDALLLAVSKPSVRTCIQLLAQLQIFKQSLLKAETDHLFVPVSTQAQDALKQQFLDLQRALRENHCIRNQSSVDDSWLANKFSVPQEPETQLDYLDSL